MRGMVKGQRVKNGGLRATALWNVKKSAREVERDRWRGRQVRLEGPLILSKDQPYPTSNKEQPERNDLVRYNVGNESM